MKVRSHCDGENPLEAAYLAAREVNKGALGMFQIFDRPRDFPDHVVVRLFMNERPTASMWTFDSIEHARAAIPERLGLYRLGRSPNDEPHIVEVWI